VRNLQYGAKTKLVGNIDFQSVKAVFLARGAGCQFLLSIHMRKEKGEKKKRYILFVKLK